MKLASTQYSLGNKSFEIYISGCKEHPCIGCCNEELWEENIGIELTNEELIKIKSKIKEFDTLIDNIFVLGGEPVEKPTEELEWLLKELKETNKEIWLFTRFELEEVPQQIKKYCSYIKTGRYDKTQLTENNIQMDIKLASKNQKIHKINGGKQLNGVLSSR